MTADGPLLLNARGLAKIVGCSEAQINAMRREGLIPPEVIHSSSYGGWTKYSRVQAERWLANEITPAHIEQAS